METNSKEQAMKNTWNAGMCAEFTARFEALDFGDLDKWEIEQNSLGNAADVPLDEQVDVAIATAKMYIDQGVSSF